MNKNVTCCVGVCVCVCCDGVFVSVMVVIVVVRADRPSTRGHNSRHGGVKFRRKTKADVTCVLW